MLLLYAYLQITLSFITGNFKMQILPVHVTPSTDAQGHHAECSICTDLNAHLPVISDHLQIISNT